MSAFRGSDQFVEFHLDCLSVSILGILNEKDHQEGDDRSESERSSASTEQLRKHCDQLNHAPQSRIARQRFSTTLPSGKCRESAGNITGHFRGDRYLARLSKR